MWGVETAPAAVYQPRNPRATSLFALVEDYYEEFERVYDDRYRQQYGAWRPVIGEVMRKYLECGDLHQGFARLACGGCRYQAILAYFCKCRLFCPSCHQKRVLLFVEWLDTHILEPVSHAQYVFTIPKLLRPICKYHRRELGLLCKSAWQALRQMFQEVAADGSVRIVKTLDRWISGRMSLSPDGSTVAFDISQTDRANEHDIYLLPTEGGNETALVQYLANDRILGWTPDGRGFLFTSDRMGTMDIWLMPIDQGKPQGSPVLIKKDAGGITSRGFTGGLVSSRGRSRPRFPTTSA
jgi:hypothetical protein